MTSIREELDSEPRTSAAELERLRAEVAAWRQRVREGRAARDRASPTPRSEVEPLYTRARRRSPTMRTTLGVPGAYPFTRGIHPTGYRGKLWTMRQFAGFGSASDTNERFKFLLAHGQTGLSTAFDFPTLMGYDSDHPRSEGEVGKTRRRDLEPRRHGGAVRRHSARPGLDVDDDQRPGDHPLGVLRRGGREAGRVDATKLRGTIQNDILKEYMAQHAWCFPIEPALRLIVDCFEWGAKHAPLWNTISISGYHIREAGSTAAQELAFTLADGFTYVERGIARGLDVDDFAPRLSFFWDIHNDFFEEIAKLRAARRIWARHMKERYGAKNPRSWIMRFHSQTAGVTLTAQQPMNNVVRVAYQALAAVLGGTQSLHTNSMDETLALPTEHAVQVALRTQQVLAYETGVPNVIDPLGGSYYVEALTDQLEREAEALFERDRRRSAAWCAGSRTGWFQRKIAESAARQQWEIEQHRRVIVGVNEFVTDEPELTHSDCSRSARTSSASSASDWRRCAPSAISARVRRSVSSGCATRRAERRTSSRTSSTARARTARCTRSARALEDVFGAYREPVFF